ncbi:MAG: DNA/RNA helicase domain-containing protein [Candidatus Paceibacterota bacterium]|jgi:hypothetical protein
MNEVNIFEIKKYDFNFSLLNKIDKNHFVDGLWPLVYILSDGNIKEAYVGETTDAISRMSTHLKNNSKNKLTEVRLITSDKFNKSATLDIESNLIKYLSGDGQFKLLNGNLGLANHTYYQKNEIYWDIFKTVWKELKSEGIIKNSLEQINNSDLFKYSPYKTLSVDQKNSIIELIKNLLQNETNSIIVEGGAGTGKTILAVFLFKLLNSDLNDFNFKDFGDDEKEFIKLVRDLKNKYPDPSMALVVPMASFRGTLKKVFRNVKGLNASMVIGPAEVVNKKYDILIVDESHRLRKRINLGTYFGAFDIVNQKLGLEKHVGNELDWIITQSKKSLFFYDENQSIKPSDVNKKDFDLLKLKKTTLIQKLNSQFRVRGGVDYVSYIDKLLNCKFRKNDILFKSGDYEFLIFDSLNDMVEKIKNRNDKFGLSRLVAGFSWPWISRKKDIHDIVIGDIKLKWNSVTKDFINSQNAINEVGCIHTTQGYDLNYTGIIFGDEISYDKEKNEIIILEENYFDKNGKQSIKNPEELKKFIINIYKTLLLRGIKGSYIYACNKNLRDYFNEHVEMYNIKNKIKDEVILSQIIESPYVIDTIGIPLVGSAPCGNPLLSEENIEEYIEVEKSKIKPGAKYFIVRADGDSMNKSGINDRDLVLCRYSEKGETGDKVVALLGGENVTIKYYDKRDGRRILLPKSTNSKHQPIIPEEGDIIQGIVQEVLEKK